MFELIPFDRRNHRVSVYDSFRTDVTDTGDSFKLEAELPGFKKDDIKIDIENDCLTISAERHENKDENRPNFVKRERMYGSYSRSFDVSGIDVDRISAAYTDGILTLELPKKVETPPASRRLEIQ